MNHAIKEIVLSFNTDAVLAQPTATSEVRLFELDNGTMPQTRLAREVWDHERYAGHRVWGGARVTNGSTYPFRQRHRYTRSERFPRLHVVLAGKEEHLLDNHRQALTAEVLVLSARNLVADRAVLQASSRAWSRYCRMWRSTVRMPMSWLGSGVRCSVVRCIGRTNQVIQRLR